MKAVFLSILLLLSSVIFLSTFQPSMSQTAITVTSINGDFTARYWNSTETILNGNDTLTGSGVCGSFPQLNPYNDSITVTHCGIVFPETPMPEFSISIISLAVVLSIALIVFARRSKFMDRFSNVERLCRANAPDRKECV